MDLSNSYLKLPELFYKLVRPTPVAAPAVVAYNEPLARQLGIACEGGCSSELTALLSGCVVPYGVQSVALAYSGHQFGHFVPLLGDGRAVLLGELRGLDGATRDLQLKGSGITPFSRRGDGRAALGPMLREYIIGEALSSLGISATRTLAVVASGEIVMRDGALPGGVQSRIAQSHVRIGTFELAARSGDVQALKALADYVIERHYPELRDVEECYLALASAIAARQATLVAQWMLVGFIHGVMNTDNVAVSGESIDFGPCAFMNRYYSETVFSSIDREGRYSYGMQPVIMQWNLARLLESFVPLLGADETRAVERAQQVVSAYPQLFNDAWLEGMRRKLGLYTIEAEDEALCRELLTQMQVDRLDYTNTFRALGRDQCFIVPEALHEWFQRWNARLDPSRNGKTYEESFALMQRVNPAVIARNHLVEEVIREGVDGGNFAPLYRLVDALRTPFALHHEFITPPSEDYDARYRTFCGT